MAASRSQTVQTQSTQVPAQQNPAFKSQESSPTITQKANDIAKSKLKQKNRKQNQFVITMPINLEVEAATVYSTSGFTPDADQDTWVVVEVEIKMSGKHGSETRVTLQKALTY